MAISRVDLLRAMNEVYAYETFSSGDPVDNFTYANPLTKWLISKKEPSPFLQGIHNEKLQLTGSSTDEWYRGDAQQAYSAKVPPVLGRFQFYNARKGFTVNMEDLANAGIMVKESGESTVTSQEKNAIVNLVKYETGKMKAGLRMQIDLALHGVSAEGGTVAPGLGSFIPISPVGNTIGTVSQVTYPAWTNYSKTGIVSTTTGAVTKGLKAAVRAVMKRGTGIKPEVFIAGGLAYDAYATDAGATINRQIIVNAKGGTGLDASVNALNYAGIPVIYDPILDYMQADANLTDAVNPWNKRFYGLSSQALHFRPHTTRWMQSYQPSATPDQPETLFWGLRTSFGLTVSQLNALCVLTIA